MNEENYHHLESMTINERLFERKLLDAFAQAVNAHDLVEIRKILFEIGVTGQHANEIARTVLADPKKYGFSG